MNRYHLLGLGPLILFSQSIFGATQTAEIAQPSACIASQFSASGDQYWKTITLKLINNCGATVDFQNSTITFSSKTAINTSFWGNFGSLSYPDNTLNISSQAQGDGNYIASLSLNFPSYQGANSKLPANGSIQISYGVSTDNHINSTTKVYVIGVAQTGGVVLTNATPKPTTISQAYAVVKLTKDGSLISDLKLPWAANLTVNGLAVGNYQLAPVNLTDSNGATYQGSASPSTISIANNANVKSTVSYTLVQQTGKLIINLGALPAKLTGYTGQPSVLLTQTQGGSSVSKTVPWNAATTVSSLKAGSAYQFSTAVISYNGNNCTPTFAPTSAIANTSTPPTTNLTYNCVQVTQDTVTLNITGAPSTLQSLKISLTPNDNSAVITQTVALANGKGSNTVQLTDGVIYTLSAPAVSGYEAAFSPQPLTASSGAVENINLTSNTGTPVGVNGQLTVCGTKLCNEQGTAIQLKGMSTHGLQWYGEGICVTPTSLDAISKNFKANVVRLALYVQEGGYENDPVKYTNQMNSLINEASKRGIYVIVDWHILSPGDPNYNVTRAKKFLTDIASLHKDKKNIIYEIANEPNGVDWASIRSYANQIIPVIRAIDSDAPIIVGTRGWSSLGISDGASYQEIVNNPVQFPNIMYSFHFYAASHRDEYLNGLDNASKVLPIFVTEFGTQTYSGDGANDLAMSDRYMQLMATKKIGWTNWNFSDDFRSGAIWKPGTCSQGAWVDSNLKESGVYIKNKIQAP